MYHVVNTEGGTAYGARSASLEFAGKTGTAQNPHGDDHGWFTAYGPFNDPQITVTVFEEHGRHGSAAGLIARDIFEFWHKQQEIKKPLIGAQ
jgi:penicillin-binding protein 2